MTELMTLSLAELKKLLQTKALSSVELTQYYLERSKKYQGDINGYIAITEDLALAKARQVDEQLAKGESGPLAGIPVAVKDNIVTRGVPTTCASRVLEGYKSPFDAAVVERLASSPLLGKVSLDEFAMGSANKTSAFGPVRNPWDLRFVPGGSSGGSAALVAAGCAPFSLGSDTGGSIRQPAAFCGVTGFKPTYGLVSRRGLVAFASSLDQIGPIARSIADCALVLQAICGHDPADATSAAREVPDFSASLVTDVRGLRLGLPRENFANCDGEVAGSVERAAGELEKAGAQIKWVSMPYQGEVLTAYMLIAAAEAASNLARFDGVKYGYRGEGQTLEEMYTSSRVFGTTVRRRLMLGTFSLAQEECSECYERGRRLGLLIARHLSGLFQECDVLLLPTSPTTAFALEEDQDSLASYYNDIFTIPANLAGLPAVSLPCGLSKGLPIGMQLMAPRFREDLLLRVGHTWQTITDWHLRRPQGVN